MSHNADNAEQARVWNEASGPKWVALQDQLDAQLEPFGERVLERLSPRPGERALDVGCGCGTTTLALAARLTPGGSVTGADVSAPMLARAGERARERGVTNVDWALGDAQERPFEPNAFHLLFSRFGVMFFADPARAFANLARALRPGARLGFVCWQTLDRNEWMALPAIAASSRIPMPPRPPPGTPGPMAFGDRNHVASVLQRGGFGNIAIDPWETSVWVGATRDLDAAVDFALQFGPVFTALSQAGPDARPAVRDAVRSEFAKRHGPDGVRLGASVWLVSATRT